jgi:ribosome biogenesis GTPase A
MVTARKEAAKAMARVDLVIEIVDARLPAASSNPMINEMRLHRQRPCLKVLNKADLADPLATGLWLRSFSAQKDTKAVAVSCKRLADIAKIPAHAASLVPHRDSLLKPVRAMVMGIPNVGKSTFINALLKRKVAKVGDEPGVTKHQARYEVSERFELIDTPGLMWPAIAQATDGLMLAASHSVGTNAYIDEEVATYLATVLLARYAKLLAARYGFATESLDGTAVIEAIAKRRSYRLRGGDLDFERASRTLLDDYRSGALGRISLETPQSRAALAVVQPVVEVPIVVPHESDTMKGTEA